jgi:hypothetical protein
MGIPKLEPLQVWPDRLVFQRETPLQIPFSAIETVEMKNWWGSPAIVLHYKDFIGNPQSLRFVDSNRLSPNKQATQELHTILQRLLAEYKTNASADGLTAAAPPDRAKLESFVQETGELQAQKEVQGWGVGLILAGLLSLFAGTFLGFSPVWGAFLLLVGLVTWRSKELPWLIVIGVAIWWAAVNNLSVGGERWIRSGLWQIVIGGVALYRYVDIRRRLRKPVADLSPVAARWMAPLALLAGVLAVLGFVADVLAYAFLDDQTWGDALSTLISPLSVLAFSAGLGSLLTFKSKRVMALIGLLLGLMVILVVLFLAFA